MDHISEPDVAGAFASMAASYAPAQANLAKLVVDDMASPHNQEFGAFGIHRQMTQAQLDELLRLRPDVINARTTLQANLSLANLEGSLSRKATAIRESLLHVISRLEAALDFSEEGYEFIQRSDARSIIERAIADAEGARVSA